MRYGRGVSTVGLAFLCIALIRLGIYAMDHVPASSGLPVMGG